MSEPSNTNKPYSHIENVKWPDDVPTLHKWKPTFKLEKLSHESGGIFEKIKTVMASGSRFYQKVVKWQAPMMSGEKYDPDAIHALQFALDCQDELSRAIESSKVSDVGLIKKWILRCQYSLIDSMLAVVIIEEGETYDAAARPFSDWRTWEGLSGEKRLERLLDVKTMFRNTMARIDFVPAGSWNDELIQPVYKEIVYDKPGSGDAIHLPQPPPTSFWIIDESLRTILTPEMVEAALALYHQGRVMGAGIGHFPIRKPKEPFPPLYDVTKRALELTIRAIDLVWRESQKIVDPAGRQWLHDWLQERKNTATGFRFAFMRIHMPLELSERTIKSNSSGQVFVLDKGEWSEWGRWSW